MDADNFAYQIEQYHSYNDYRYNYFVNRINKFQHDLIDALALLFHLNMSMLPGYMGKMTPHGIKTYNIENQKLNSLKTTNKQLDLDKIETVSDFSIEAIYLQECFKTNELVVWIIHKDDLSDNLIRLLINKATFIEKQYRKQHLNIKFRVTNRINIAHTYYDTVTSNPHIDKQFFLDEFYVESILLAGKPAFFWVTNENSEPDYKTALTNNDIEDEYLDFNDNHNFRLQDYYSAALWHLLNISHSPLTTWINITILFYQMYNNIKHDTYSKQLKQKVQNDNFETSKEDPYILYAAYINNIIHETFKENLSLIDKDFIQVLCNAYKCKNTIYSKSIYDHIYELNYCLINTSKKTKIDLDVYIKSLESLYSLTSTIWSNMYNNITKSSKNSPTKNQDLFLISDRLSSKLKHYSYNNFILNLNNINLYQEKIIIQYNENYISEKWNFLIPADFDSKKYIKSFDSIIELLTWCYINNIIDCSTQISTNCPDSIITSNEMINIVNILTIELESTNFKQNDLNAYTSTSMPVISILFINENEHDDLSQDRVTQLIIYNTGEFYTSYYPGYDKVMACLYNWIDLINNPELIVEPTIHVYNIKPNSNNTLKYNISDLLKKFYNQTNTNSHSISNTRTILKKDNKYLVSYLRKGNIRSEIFDNRNSFLKHLEIPLDDYTYSVFTDTDDHNSLIGYLLSQNMENNIQLFYYLEEKNVTTYIFDENGTLFTYTQKLFNRQCFINHWIIFFHNMKRKCLANNTVSINQLIKITDSLYEHIPLTGKMLPSDDKYYDLNLKITDKDQNINVSFTCENETFNSIDHGREIYNEISRFISNNIPNSGAIPVYISNIDLADSLLTSISHVTDTKSSLIDYLRYKRNVENRINMKINQ